MAWRQLAQHEKIKAYVLQQKSTIIRSSVPAPFYIYDARYEERPGDGRADSGGGGTWPCGPPVGR
jgi:hypothetical protein